MRYVSNVIASVGRQNDVYRPIKIQKSYRPTLIFNVIAALITKDIYLSCSSAHKTAITLAPPTVGRQSADLSADKMPDFSSFFIGRQKINYNYLVIIFFHRPTVWGFGNRPMIGRRSADDRPISWPMTYLNEPHIIGRSMLTTYHRPMCRPTVGRRSADCKVLGLV